MVRGARLFAAVAALVLVSSAHAAVAPAPDASWLAFGHDPQITNFVAAPGYTTAAGRRLATAWTADLDGGIVASPLSAPIPAGGNAVFVAT